MATLNDYVQSFIFEEIDKDNLLELEKILKPSKIMNIINDTIENRSGNTPDNIYAEEMDVKLNKNNSGISIKSTYGIDMSGSSIKNITLLFKIFSSEIKNNLSSEKNNKFRVCIDGELKSGKNIYEELDYDIPRQTSHTDYFYETMVKVQINKALEGYINKSRS